MINKFKFKKCKQHHSINHFGETVLGIQLDDSEYNTLLHASEFFCVAEPSFQFQKIGRSTKYRLNFTLYHSGKTSRYFIVLTKEQIVELVKFKKIGFVNQGNLRVWNDGLWSTITIEISNEGYQEIERFFLLEIKK